MEHGFITGMSSAWRLKRLEKDLESAREKEVLRDFEREVVAPASSRPAAELNKKESPVQPK